MRGGRRIPSGRALGIALLAAALPAAAAVGQSGRHVVRGRVVDVTTGAPLAGVEILLLGHPPATVTDRAGRFRHERLADASYLMQVRKRGYVTMTWEVRAAADTSIVHLLELHPVEAEPAEDDQASGRQGRGVVRGRVVEAGVGTPVADAEVLILGRPGSVRTDADGRFRHGGLAATAHMLVVRKVGYEPLTVQIPAGTDTAVSHRLELLRADVPVMDTVVVEGTPAELGAYWLADFERRRVDGRGQYVTRREILQRNAYSLGDLLRTLNGLRMVCGNAGCAVRMTRTNCRPAYFADGFPADAVTVERMPVNDLFGVEVYDMFEVPIELQRSDLRCGVIAVWTRRGPPPRR